MSRHVDVDENCVVLTQAQYEAAKTIVETSPDAWEVFDEEGCGWSWSQDTDGTWTLSLDAESTDEDADCRVFNLFAPLVPAGQFIVLHSEYGDKWRYYFDGTSCRLQRGKVTY